MEPQKSTVCILEKSLLQSQSIKVKVYPSLKVDVVLIKKISTIAAVPCGYTSVFPQQREENLNFSSNVNSGTSPKVPAHLSPCVPRVRGDVHADVAGGQL